MSEAIISADGHIDLPVCPADLFTKNAPAGLRDRVPHVIETDDGKFWVNHKGTRLGLYGGMGSAGRRYEPGQIQRADRIASTGLYEDQARGIMRTADPELRIRDQQLDGVDGEVIYGILGACQRAEDDRIAAAMVRIYNDFAADFCRARPERFAMIGILPQQSAEDTADEIRRCRTLGLRGVELPVTETMKPLWHPDWEPLWRAVEETGLPLHMHTIGGHVDTSFVKGREQYLRWLAAHISCFQLSMATHVSSIIFSGALERYPGVRVVIGESGLGWIPYLLERMDYEWEDQFQNLDLRMKPSEYWQRQMYATFQQDDVGLELIERLGRDNVMWGSDFPHPDGLWPDSRKFLDRMFEPLPLELRRKLTYETAAEVYGFPQADAVSA
ncbi:MAG: amidohydrolase family protein [Myxococcota bacterium]|nr:amidohydrolase family protein [Myxococcota bacterium]